MAAVVITDYADDFSDVWPSVERRLRARLHRRGVPASTIDDVVQDTAVVALARQVPFTTADELLAWTTTVACRLAVADYRRGARLHLVGDVPDGTVRPVDDEALHRIEAAAALEAIPLLSAADRAALAPTGAGLTRAEAVRLNVRRHRARNRLRALAAVSWAIVAAIAVRRHLRAVERVVLVTSLSGAAVGLYALTLPFTAHGRDEQVDARPPAPAFAPAAEQQAAVAITAPVPQSPAAAPGSHEAKPFAAADAPRPGGAPTLPDASVAVETPTGDGATVDTETGAPTQLAVCVAVLTTTETCAIEVPIPATPLDDL